MSAVTWLVTRCSNSSSNLRSRPPQPPKVPASRFPSGEPLGLMNFPETLASEGWCLPGGWSSSSRRRGPSAPVPLQTVASALPGDGAPVLPGPFHFPGVRGKAGRLQPGREGH